jgi:hypothetical protein
MVTKASKWLPAPEMTDRAEYPPVQLSPQAKIYTAPPKQNIVPMYDEAISAGPIGNGLTAKTGHFLFENIQEEEESEPRTDEEK